MQSGDFKHMLMHVSMIQKLVMLPHISIVSMTGAIMLLGSRDVTFIAVHYVLLGGLETQSYLRFFLLF